PRAMDVGVGSSGRFRIHPGSRSSRPAQRRGSGAVAQDGIQVAAYAEVKAKDYQPSGRPDRESSTKEGSSMNAIVEHKPESRAVAQVTPSDMLMMAVQKGADMAQLEKLMELQERWQANQARKAFDEAIAAAKAKIKPIVKK